jgi:hypothetical protein
MTAKEYLSQARRIRIRLDAMSEQLVFLKAAAEYTSPCISDMPKGPRNIHRTEDAYIRVMEKEEQITAAQATLSDIVTVIGMVGDPAYEALLTKRYLTNKTWSEIINDLHYGCTRIYEIHNEALAIVDEILKERSKAE